MDLPRPHSAQARVKSEARRFNALACGRRWGKTTLGIDVALEAALYGRPVAWFSPTYKLLSEAWREIKGSLTPMISDKSETEHRLELLGGGVLECWSLDGEDPARGRKYKRVVVDEAAMTRDLLPKWEEAIRPTLSDLIGDAWFLSTPKGLNGFYALHQRGQDELQTDWASWRSPTSDNPYISPQEIEDARRDLPERTFAQEYLAEFVVDGAAVFRNVLEAASVSAQSEANGSRYAFGVDWGRQNDFTVVSVVDVHARRQVWIERFNQIDYHVQTGRLAILAQRFRPSLIVVEANSVGTPQLEQLGLLGLPVVGWTATNASKYEAINALAMALERREIALLSQDHPVGRVQVGELLAYEAERLPSGLMRYGAPDGMHDDTVIALALSWLAACAPDGRTQQFAFRVEA